MLYSLTFANDNIVSSRSLFGPIARVCWLGLGPYLGLTPGSVPGITAGGVGDFGGAGD